MSPKLTRRDFIRLGALTTTAAVVSGCTIDLQRKEKLESYVLPPEEGLPGENLLYATTCRQCAAGCGIIVRVSEGRARKIEGNPLHPINQGKLCARGQAALQELYDPDRLENAVEQTNRRGSLQFTPKYWEEAVQHLQEWIVSATPGRIAFLGGNPSSHQALLVGRFMEALGGRPPLFYTLANELEGYTSLSQSTQNLFGEATIPIFDIGNTDVVFSFGANFLETWLSPVSYSRAYAQLRRGPLGKRGYLVQFEPRLSSTAACADEWVSLRPGTEGWVALALGKIIVDNGWAKGGDTTLYTGVSVERIASISGIASEKLEHLARTLATAQRAVAIPGGVLAAQNTGTAAITAVQALNLLLGQIGQAGGVFLPAAPEKSGFSPVPVTPFEEIKGLIADMQAGQVEVLFLHGANPAFDLPEAASFVRALENVPLVVSFNPVVNETAAMADWILPDHTNLESWGYHVPTIADRPVVSGLQPVVHPLYDTRATVDVLLAIAQGLGLSELPWRNETEFLRETTRVWQDEGLTDETAWAAWRRRGGWWPDYEALKPPTVSGPLELPSLPTPVAEEEAFYLHLYPSITLYDGRGANKAWLQETPDPMTTVSWQTWIEVHPHTAEHLGLHDDDIVKIISPAGEIEAIVYTFPGIREDTVAIPIGRGHKALGRFSKEVGSNPVELLNSDLDGETGALPWATMQVRIEATGRTRALARLESAEGIAYLRGEGH
jgi:anaerobic selenocysteine-containing dehydrogenase